MNQLIWYPKCSTCKAAKRMIENCGLEFTLRDVKEEKLTLDEVKELIQKTTSNPYLNLHYIGKIQ